MIRNGKRHERHMCETCAKAEGMAGQGHIPITQLLNQFITSQAQGSPPLSLGKVVSGHAMPGCCGTCSLTIAQFKQSGLLGCPDCYAAFEAQLAPLLQRAHEGGTQHTGKKPARVRQAVVADPPPVAAPPRTPGRIAVPAEKETSVREVLETRAAEARKLLAAAVAAEQYEDAAKLRDELVKLDIALSAVKPARRTPKPRQPRGGESEGA